MFQSIARPKEKWEEASRKWETNSIARSTINHLDIVVNPSHF
jgi:hypothetical protein